VSWQTTKLGNEARLRDVNVHLCTQLDLTVHTDTSAYLLIRSAGKAYVVGSHGFPWKCMIRTVRYTGLHRSFLVRNVCIVIGHLSLIKLSGEGGPGRFL
jgi:hypothetical protein